MTSAHESRPAASSPTLNVIQLPSPTSGSFSPVEGDRPREDRSRDEPPRSRDERHLRRTEERHRAGGRERSWRLNRERRYEPWDRVTLGALEEVAPQFSIEDRDRLARLWLSVPRSRTPPQRSPR